MEAFSATFLRLMRVAAGSETDGTGISSCESDGGDRVGVSSSEDMEDPMRHSPVRRLVRGSWAGMITGGAEGISDGCAMGC